MRPCTGKSDITPTRRIIILRVNVKVGHLLDQLTRGIQRNTSQIQNAKTQAIVALIRESILDELVVVNTTTQTLVMTRLLGLFERGNVPDVGDGVPIGA